MIDFSQSNTNRLSPHNLQNFTGQKEICHNLSVFIESARKRNQVLDHVLLFGSPGLGKTTLSQIISYELGVGFYPTSGPIIKKAGDLAALLTNLQPKDVIFIDEIHRLNIAIEEILYPAMEEFKLDIMIGNGPAAKSIRIDLPPFTLIGATTRFGLLTKALRDRFGIPLHLQQYTNEELINIIFNIAKSLIIDITYNAAMEIAKRSRGTPRLCKRLLHRIRDFALVDGKSIINQVFTNIVLKKLEIDEIGLQNNDRLYLYCLETKYNGGPVGIENMTAALSETRNTIEDVIEPYLIEAGLIQRTLRGRILTQAGYNHLHKNYK